MEHQHPNNVDYPPDESPSWPPRLPASALRPVLGVPAFDRNTHFSAPAYAQNCSAKPRTWRGRPVLPTPTPLYIYSQMERFFRRFGMPGERSPTIRVAPRATARPVSGQGSGFFISADGYAVTNNHVVDKADTVEIDR